METKRVALNPPRLAPAGTFQWRVPSGALKGGISATEVDVLSCSGGLTVRATYRQLKGMPDGAPVKVPGYVNAWAARYGWHGTGGRLGCSR